MFCVWKPTWVQPPNVIGLQPHGSRWPWRVHGSPRQQSPNRLHVEPQPHASPQQPSYAGDSSQQAAEANDIGAAPTSYDVATGAPAADGFGGATEGSVSRGWL
ncbi:hypothetical protein Pla108_38600 [Botrimarina colliarenosi]|uniref:Uncharacterized protein n=1 Tax=Botrimarina colliarenosi TaxID=2528001 RepID=A0A5C6A1Q7_9BACT|nr:hypothetical protein Pla108_38600 [Botrimarina colliarenosi]